MLAVASIQQTSSLLGTGFVNVCWPRFGALGDGVTNDTVAVQAAIDSGGGAPITVYFPPGTYLCRISVPSNVTLIGYGATLKLDAHAGTADEYTSVVDLASDPLGTPAAVSNIAIYGFRIDGNRSVGGPYVTHPDGYRQGISIGDASDVLLEDVTIYDCYTDGLFLAAAGPSRITCTRVVSYNNWRHGAAIIAGSDIALDRCRLASNGGVHPTGSYGAGLDIEDDSSSTTGVSNVNLTRCDFEGNTNNGVAIQSYFGHAISNVSISRSTFDGNGSYDLLVYGAGYTLDTLEASRNEFTGGGIYIGAGSGSQTYRNIELRGNTGVGLIYFGGTTATSYENGIISRNECTSILCETADVDGSFRVERNDVAAATAPTAFTDRGICFSNFGANHTPRVASDAYGASIRENLVTGGCFGIQVSGAPYTLIAQNTVKHQRAVDPGSGYAGGYGISIDATSIGSTIEANTVVDADTRGIYNGAAYATLRCNTVLNCSGGPAGGAAGIYSDANYTLIESNTARDNTGALSYGDWYLDPAAVGVTTRDNRSTTGQLSDAEGGVDPRWYGAATNGTADARAALAAADAAAVLAGRPLCLHAGTYRIASNLTLSALVRVERGARFSLADGVRLTFAGPLEAGFYQIFELGTGAHAYGLTQPETVKLHWWGITENDALVDNATALYEAVSSFVSARVSFGGAAIYLSECRFQTDAAPYASRRLEIDGAGAQLICSSAPAVLTGPVFQVNGGHDLYAHDFDVSMQTQPDPRSDGLVGWTHLFGLGGYQTNWPAKVRIERVNASYGWQCGIVPYHCDEAYVSHSTVHDVLGTGIYFVNVAYHASCTHTHVYHTRDDSLAFVSDTELPAGTSTATVDDFTTEDNYGGSGVTFAGVRYCTVGERTTIANTWSSGIRYEVGGQGVTAAVIHINGPTLIRCGRAQHAGGASNPFANASGIALSGIDDAVVKIAATVFDAKYAGVYVPEDCAEITVHDSTVNGKVDLEHAYVISATTPTTLQVSTAIDDEVIPTAGTLRVGVTVYTYSGYSGDTFSGVTPDPSGETGAVDVIESPTSFGAVLGADAAPATTIDKAVVRGCHIRRVNVCGLYASHLKDINVEDCTFDQWNLAAGGYAAVGFISCDRARLDTRRNRFLSAGTTVESTGTPNYRGLEEAGAPNGCGPSMKQVNHSYVTGAAIAYAAYDASLICVVANGVQADGAVLLPDTTYTRYFIYNTSGYTITPQVSGGGGTPLSTGEVGLYIHMGTDYIRVA